VVEPQPNLYFARHSSPGERLYAVCEPAFCVLAQGSKKILLGEDRVGYDDASPFNRDYKRHFGAPPMRVVEQLRELSAQRNKY
jgi:AraC-like DNA-binding protein